MRAVRVSLAAIMLLIVAASGAGADFPEITGWAPSAGRLIENR